MYQALAASSRREILSMLRGGPLSVKEITFVLGISMAGASQHLSILREAQLVSSSRSGKQIIYSLTPEPLKEVSDWVKHYEDFWKDKLHSLGAHLDEQHEHGKS